MEALHSTSCCVIAMWQFVLLFDNHTQTCLTGSASELSRCPADTLLNVFNVCGSERDAVTPNPNGWPSVSLEMQPRAHMSQRMSFSGLQSATSVARVQPCDLFNDAAC